MNRPLILALLTTLCVCARAQVTWHKLAVADGVELEYALNLPEGYDSQRTYPVLLALPRGPQTREMVEEGLRQYWGAQARAAGWVVVSPVAPRGVLFFAGAESVLPLLFARIREQVRISQGRMHLVGQVNGGRSAFRIATLYPYEFQSITVMPGHASPSDNARLKRLRNTRVRMFVGGEDDQIVSESRKTYRLLTEQKINVTLKELPDQGTAPSSLDDGGLMKHLVALHAASAWPDGAIGDVHRTLDDFNDAAAKADEDRYFGLFAPEATFLGTDPTERWSLEEFKSFAMPYFKQRDSAWTYIPQQRWVDISPAGDTAWFHERLGNASYGGCRGTGTLRKVAGNWKVALYDLTIPVPNDVAGGVVRQIRDFNDGVKLGATTVILVRHAEKDTTPGAKDPALTSEGVTRAQRLAVMLKGAGIDTIYSSEFRRTKATVAPLSAGIGVPTVVIPAGDMAGLVHRLKTQHGGETVIVSGHSNTLPQIMQALGVTPTPRITDGDYDGLYVVTLGADGTRLTKLSF